MEQKVIIQLVLIVPRFVVWSRNMELNVVKLCDQYLL